MEKKISTKDIILIGMFAAMLAVMSQLHIPMPSGVPATIQIFAVSLIGYVLGWKYGLASVGVYILLGAVGVPVFAGLQGGFQVLVNTTGGFVWGWLFLVAACGIGYQKHILVNGVLSLIGLLICYLLGTLQFMVVTSRGFMESFLLVGAPYLVKDIVLMVAAFFVAKAIRAGIRAAGVSAA